jgi:hypothetical protein
VLLQAPRGVFEHLAENRVGKAYCAGEAHVAGGWIDGAFRDVGHDGRYKRVVKAARDRFSIGGDDAYIVFADRIEFDASQYVRPIDTMTGC